METLSKYHIIHSYIGLGHTLLAIAAMVLGIIVFRLPKGGRVHRTWGYAYVVSMLLMNLSSFGIYTWGGVSLFHGLAIISLLTLFVGVWHAYTRKSQHWMVWHYYFMAWSVVGLYCAFWAEVGVRFFDMRYFWWVVMIASGATAGVGGYYIHHFSKKIPILQQNN